MPATMTPEPSETKSLTPWEGFRGGIWQKELDVRDFIQQNYRPYEGDDSFLEAATERTRNIWNRLKMLFIEERKKGVLDISQIPGSITAHGPGYIDRENEIIVGLQTDAPLKRSIMPNGGLRMVLSALKAYGYKPDPHIVETFSKYRKTHNEGVFDAYTADIRRCRSSHILTGLPDAYGRGRIIGDYRRVALYGVSRLIEVKQREKQNLDSAMSTDEIIRPGTTVDKLAGLKPAFYNPGYEARFPQIKWEITAGNSSPLSDGSAALLITTSEAAHRLGLRPLARIHTATVVGSDPLYMLTGVIPATEKVLQRAGLTLADIDLFEVNEAFAPVVVAWAHDTGADLAKTNVNGGAIAIGHPLGASGTRIMTTMVNALEQRGGRYGLQTMCEAGGMANATIIERL